MKLRFVLHECYAYITTDYVVYLLMYYLLAIFGFSLISNTFFNLLCFKYQIPP